MLVSDYLFNVLNEKTDPSILIKWILGDLSEETFPEIRRSDFALYFLNYLQEQTSSVIECSSYNKKEDAEYKQSNENKSNSDYKHGVSRRQTPGHVRRIFPSPGEKSAAHSVKRTITGQPSCETLPYNLQQRNSVPSPFSGPGSHGTGYVASAPMLYDPQLGYNVPYYNNYNRSYNNYQPPPQSNLFATGSSTNLTNHFLNENNPLCNTNVSPNFLNLSPQVYNANYPSLMLPVADSPIKADQPDFSLKFNKASTQSPQSSGKKHFQTPKTPKSNRIEQKSTPNSGSSCSSSVSVMSPESPMYSENFPAMMSASERRTRRENSRTSTDSGDSQSKKHSHNKKRIKPTQLSKTIGNSPMQDNFGKEIKTESKLFQQVPETFPERKQNFFQKEELTKQENTNNIATCSKVTNSESEIDSGDKKLCDKIYMETETASSPLAIECTDNKTIQTKSCNKNIKSGVKLNLCTPDASKVNYKCYLNRLAEIYSALLDANLVPNITAELYFIFSLLTVNINESQTKWITTKINLNSNETCVNDMSDCIQVMELSSPDDDGSQSGLENLNNHTPAKSTGNDSVVTSKADVNLQLFNSIHQCVYFACAVISQQEHFLEILDKATLKLLIDNKRLFTFIPEVAQSLTRLYFKKDTELKTKQNYQLTPDEITINPVPFQMEIDNKDTFASESSFHMFRKQRDGFYEILQTWNEKHFRPDWNFNLLTPKIEKLFQMSDDPVNMRHLARHFCDLILKSVTQMDTGTDEFSVSGMPEIDRSKLNRLTERLTGPPLSGQKDPRPSPGFPGLQAFYHDFLVIPAANYSFHTHVINCIAGRIHALNETSFQLEEPDINGQVVQQETRFAFLQCLRSLCVLAKFLGLLVFGPYRCSKDLPQSVLQDEIITRSKILPPLDFQKYLTSAEEEGRLVQTVPWVVEYLGMMDSAAPYLKTYQTILSTLFSIYLFTSPKLNSVITNGSSSNECSINSSSVRISVNCSNENIETKSDTSLLGRKSKFSMQTAVLLRLSIGWLFDTSNFSQSLFYNMASIYKENKEKEKSEEKWHNVTVDCSNIVDEKVLHDCCPYLNNLRVRLIESTNLKQGSIRHVTPVPSNHLSSTSEALASQTLELQLEENFFMGQSESLRKTVDFVAERVASACIKHICSNVIVSLKNKVYKLKVKKQQVDLQQYIDNYNESVKKEIENGINQRLNIALTALIGPDVVDQSVNVMCRQIAARKLQERVINWLQTHICISEIFNKLPTDSNTQHDPHSYVQVADGKASEDLYTTSEALIFMQDLLNDVLDTRGTAGIITSEEFVVTMEQLSASFPLFGDNASNIKLLFSLVLDYMLQCITFRPAMVTEDVMDAFCNLWKLWNYSGPLNRILSQRNIIMLVQGGSAKVWDKFGEFIVFTLTHDVLTITDLECQAVGFFRYTWPEEILQAMSKCIRGIVENVQKHSSCVNDPKFVLMLEFCSEIATYVNDELEELY